MAIMVQCHCLNAFFMDSLLICRNGSNEFVFKLSCHVNPHLEMPHYSAGCQTKSTVHIFAFVTVAALYYCFKSQRFGLNWSFHLLTRT